MYNPLNSLLRRKSRKKGTSGSASIALNTLKGNAPGGMPAPAMAVRDIGSVKTTKKTVSKKASAPVQVITPSVAPTRKRTDTKKVKEDSKSQKIVAKPADEAPVPAAKEAAKTASKTTRTKVSDDSIRLDTFKRVARANKLSVAWDKTNNQFAQPYTQQAYLFWMDGLERASAKSLQAKTAEMTQLRARLKAQDAEIEQMTDDLRHAEKVAVNLMAAVRRFARELKKLDPKHELIGAAHRYMAKLNF